MIESVADARVRPDVLTLGAVFLVQLNDELLEGTMVAVEHLHVLVVAKQLGDCHYSVGQ